MAEILVKISKLEVRMSEVPLVLRYDKKAGASKMRIGRTVMSTVKMLVRLRFAGSQRRLRGSEENVE
jgi:dolichol-phosphate mannosyltransferase